MSIIYVRVHIHVYICLCTSICGGPGNLGEPGGGLQMEERVRPPERLQGIYTYTLPVHIYIYITRAQGGLGPRWRARARALPWSGRLAWFAGGTSNDTELEELKKCLPIIVYCVDCLGLPVLVSRTSITQGSMCPARGDPGKAAWGRDGASGRAHTEESRFTCARAA
jgi:hypothetical protein